MYFTGISSGGFLIFLVLVTDCYTDLWYINPERPTKIFVIMYIISMNYMHKVNNRNFAIVWNYVWISWLEIKTLQSRSWPHAGVFIANFKHISRLALLFLLLTLNPLGANTTKCPNTLKQFVGKSRRIVSVCLTILWDWSLKG